ncbi:O-antigen ligase family protein [Pseudomonas indica]|uniref:O-antigen ligase family protein n=1 Tax=Pseudomonas indica TaxID=137658 RepID=UPI0023F6F2AE|nr:O-antigen ligase family protein [Pseudomonas indica]MBU3057067.1 O-antigen ligase family protein [Pseudomonas indica]
MPKNIVAGGGINFFAKLSLMFFVLGLLVFFGFLGWGGGRVNYDGSVIFFASLLWFVFLLVVGGVSERLFWQFAPFAIFFTPNAVNDFWPSSPMATGEASPYFSYFTHIDIYLLMGVLAYCDFQRNRPKREVFMLFALLLALLIVFLAAIWRGDFWHVLQGGYQLRYLIYFLLLFIYADPFKYEGEFSLSLKAVLILIVFEAIVFSLVKGEQRLTSGNYGVNSLGHLMAAGTAFLVLQVGGFSKKIGNYFLALGLALAMVATATRFSLVALFSAFSMIYILKRGKFSSFVFGLLILIGMFAFFVSFVPAGESMWEGLLMIGQNVNDPSAISVTPESSSMVTRLRLWWATLEMIGDHPWLGIGPGVWAFLKVSYGVEFESILDPHQDLLNYLVSYGVILGGALFISVFILPILKVGKSRRLYSGSLWGWVGIILVLLFSGATNAVTWKHQISALAYFSSFMVVFWNSRFVGHRV